VAAQRQPKPKRKKEKKRKTMQVAKSSSHQLRERGHLGRKVPSPEKKKAVSEDQDFCPEHDVKLQLGGLVLKGPQFDSDWG